MSRKTDPEMLAMQQMARQLAKFTPAARARIMTYLYDRANEPQEEAPGDEAFAGSQQGLSLS